MPRRQNELVIWRGGEHEFFLGIGELRAIEQRTDSGVAVVLKRLLSGDFRIDDVHSTLRLGLIGGGMTEREARQILDEVMAEANIYTLAVAAAEVLRRFILWDDTINPTGEAAGTTRTKPTTSRPSETTAPVGSDILQPEPSSDTLPSKSMN